MRQHLDLRDDIANLFQDHDPFQQAAGLQGEVFRDVNGRRTLRFVAGERAYFAKFHPGVGWGEIFKNLLSGHLPVVGAATEYRAIRRLNDLHIPTMTIAGFGQRGLNPARRQSFLVTDDLSPAVSLETLCAEWPQQRPPFTFKTALIHTLADIARRMHAQAIFHRDFYLCHFLLTSGKSLSPQLSVIDLHRALIQPVLRRRWQIKDMAGLYFSSLGAGLTRTDYARFIRAYTGLPLRKALGTQAAFWRKVRKRAEHIWWRDQRKDIEKALSGIYRSNEQQSRVQNFLSLAVFRKGFDGPDLKAFIADPDAMMRKGHMLKDGDSTTVVSLDFDGHLCVVKRYNLRSFWYGLRRLMRRSRASHCWLGAHLLNYAGIDTPEPVMMLERRWGPFRRKAYYVSVHADGQPLAEQLARQKPGNEVWLAVASQFRHYFRQMAHYRLVHGDLKVTNFMASDVVGNEKWPDQGLVVLDLDASRREANAKRFAKYFRKDLNRFLANWDDENVLQVMRPVADEAATYIKNKI